jgi:two-component system, cell cycle response regulator
LAEAEGDRKGASRSRVSGVENGPTLSTMSAVHTIESTEAIRQVNDTRHVNRVLVAEDDPVTRRILEVRLRNWNYEVVAFDSGFHAWEAIQANDAPELLLLDWMMPGVDGIELCRRIRALNKPVYPYILLLTARATKQDILTGFEAGADDYLTKPFHVDELHARLRAGSRILTLQSELIQTREQLRFHATHDALTGVWNRKGISDLLTHELARAKRTNEPLGLMMIDLDHFKSVNDTYGHAVGDEVLKEIASRLALSVRSYDLVGRYGGEEFLVILSGATIEEVRRRAQRLCAVLEQSPVRSETREVRVTISIGAVEAPINQLVTQNRLVELADRALYRAKELGRNRVETCVYESESGSETAE